MIGEGSDLSVYRNHARVLVIVADDATDPRLARQQALLRGSDRARSERRLELVMVAGSEARLSLGVLDAARVRRGLRLPGGRGFRVVLVGQDGAVKLIRRTPVRSAEVFAAIDAMPMRREEMRRSSD